MDWYPWYPALFEADTLHLSFAEEGAYRRLIDKYMVNRQPPPDDDQALARLLGVGLEDWLSVAANVRPFFKSRRGRLRHKRCDAVLNEQDRRSKHKSEIGKKGAEARHGKSQKVNGVSASAMPLPRQNVATRQDKTGQEKPNGFSYTSQFDEFWKAYPSRLNSSKRDAFNEWNKRLKEGHTPEEMIHGARCYQAWCDATGTTGQYIAHGRTWLHGARHRDYAGKTPEGVTAASAESDRRRNGGGTRQRATDIDSAFERIYARRNQA